MPVLNYKKEMRSQEVAQLEGEIDNLQSELHTVLSEIKEVQAKKIKMQSVDDISGKPTILDASKIIVTKAEFDEVKALAKKQIAGDKKDKKLITDNKRLQAENQNLRQEVQTQKAELSEFKSVRNQLSIGAIMAENQQLKGFKEKVLRFVEKLGLKQQFDKFMKGNVEKER